MTLELLHVIRDYTIHLQGHQYQIMQVMYVYTLVYIIGAYSCSNALIVNLVYTSCKLAVTTQYNVERKASLEFAQHNNINN